MTPKAPTFTISRAGFRAGAVASAPVHLAVGPFGLVFGVLAAEVGLDLIEAMAMTTIVVAGASQFAALQLMTENAPTVLVILTGAAINMRMAMYSASIAAEWRGAPTWARVLAAYCLNDQAFALSMRRYAERPVEAINDRVGFYFGVGATTVFTWVVSSFIGFQLGAAVPESWSLDFAVPITFLAVVAPMLRSAPHIVAAMTGIVVSLGLVWLPFSIGVLVGGVAGVVAGAVVERLMRRETEATT